MFSSRRKQTEKSARENGDAGNGEAKGKETKLESPTKKIPVFFVDEAHKL